MAVIEERYGNALLELAKESKSVKNYLDEVVTLRNAFMENPELLNLLNNPKITLEEKIAVTEKCFAEAFLSDIVGLLVLIIKNQRASEIVKVLDYFISEAKKDLKIGVVYVESAMELDDARKKALESKILTTAGYLSLETHYSVNPSLIGGIKVRLGDRIIDNSIKTKLGELSASLRQASV